MRIAIHVGKRHSLDDQRLLRTAKALKFGIGNSEVIVNPPLAQAFDFIHAHDLDALPKALLHKALTSRKTKVVYDAHEDWSQYRKPYVRWAEAMMLPFVDAAVSSSPVITLRLAKTVKVTTTILNCPDLPLPSTEPKYPNFTVAYVGKIGPHRGYPQLIEAARILNEQNLTDIRYLLMGSGTIDIPSDIRIQFELTGQLPHAEMMKRLQRCHLGLILFEDTPNNRIALPHKLFEYLACGLDVVAPNHCSQVTSILDEARLGYSLAAVAPKLIAYCLRDAKERYPGLALNALLASKNGFNARVQAAKLTALYGRLS